MSSSTLLTRTSEPAVQDAVSKTSADSGPLREGSDKLRECVAEVCIGLQLLAYSSADGRASRCQELQAQIEVLMRSPGFGASSYVARHCTALANFLRALCKYPEDITEANLRTVSSAAGVLDALFRGLGAAQELHASSFTAVLLDGKNASRQKVSAALAAAGFEVVPFSSPAQLLQHLESTPTDLVVLNIPVPVPEGFDVSMKIPKLALHEKTPILVSLSTTPSGVAAEFLIIAEIVLKSLTLVHKSRLSAAPAVVVPLTSAEGPIPPELLHATPRSNEGTSSAQALSGPAETEDVLRASLEKEVEERKQLTRRLQEALAEKAELELRLQTMREGNESSFRQQAARFADLERELSEQRRANEELRKTLTVKQDVEKQVSHRAEELEKQLGQRAAELEQIKAEFQQKAGEREGLEAELRAQVSAAEQAAKQAESGSTQQAARCAELESQMEGLRQANDNLSRELAAQQNTGNEAERRAQELANKLEEGAAAYQRAMQELEQRSADLQNAKAARERENAEREKAQSEWNGELQVMQAAAQQAETTRQQSEARCSQLQSELAQLRAAGEEVQKQLRAEQQAAALAQERARESQKELEQQTADLENAKASLEKESAERERLQTEWSAQLQAVNAAARQAETTSQQKASRCSQLETELAQLRAAGEEVKKQLRAEQQASSLAQERACESEKQLEERNADLQNAKAHLEQEGAERARLQSEWSAQLQAMKAAVQQAETSTQKYATRCQELETETSALQVANQELRKKDAEWQREAEESAQRARALEERLGEGSAELEQVKAQIEQQEHERQRLQAEHQQLLEARTALMQELSNARESETAAHLKTDELERRVREAVTSLARVTADLQKERGDRQRAEDRVASAAARLKRLHEQLGQHLDLERASQSRITELEKALQEREDALATAVADLQKEAADRKSAEEQLRAAGELDSRLEANSALLEEARNSFKHALEEVETRLQATRAALSQAESSLQKETNERLRLQETAAAAERKAQERIENSRLEKSKLEMALQLEGFERKRLETDLLRSRHVTLQSAHASGSVLNSLRRQLRQPAKDLHQCACTLLQAELPEDQKKVVEAMLEKTLLLETTLQGNGNANGEADVQVPEAEETLAEDASTGAKASSSN